MPVTYSARKLESMKKPGRYRVDDCLYLKVDEKKDKVYKRWVLRYQVANHRTEVGLGPYSKVSMKDAKDKAEALLAKLAIRGEDPKDAEDTKREKTKLTKRQQQAAKETFEMVADRYIEEIKRPVWKDNGKSEAQWRSTLLAHVYPVIGDKPIQRIDQADVEAIVRPIWVTTHETADRTLGRIRSIIEYYIATNQLDKRNPAQYVGYLEHVLPEVDKRAKHFPALPYSELPEFFQELSAKKKTSHDALKLIVLTAQRQGDVRSARWEQFDLDKAIWDCVVNKRKKNEDAIHRVPLPKEAVGILERRAEHSGNEEYVFASEGGRGCVTEHALRKALAVLRRTDEAGRKITMHGFRATLMNWSQVYAIETDKLVEQQLAHVEKDQTLAAYMRADLLGRRAVLMQKYADYAMGTFVPEVPS